jgi:hypothetical protein
MARAVHYKVGPEAADDLSHPSDAFGGSFDVVDIDRRFGAKLARQSQARAFRGTDANHSTRAHFLRRRDG